MLGTGEEVCSGEVSSAVGEIDGTGASEMKVGEVVAVGTTGVSRQFKTYELDLLNCAINM